MKGGVFLGPPRAPLQERETTAEGVRVRGVVWITEGTSLVRCAVQHLRSLSESLYGFLRRLGPRSRCFEPRSMSADVALHQTRDAVKVTPQRCDPRRIVIRYPWNRPVYVGLSLCRSCAHSAFAWEHEGAWNMI